MIGPPIPKGEPLRRPLHEYSPMLRHMELAGTADGGNPTADGKHGVSL